MASLRAHAAMTFFRTQKRLLLLHPNNTDFMRLTFENMSRLAPIPKHLRLEQIHVGHIPVDILHNQRAGFMRERVLFYIHGGGFVVGSPASHRSFAGRLGQRTWAAQIWSLDYRRAPEHPFPAALDDVMSVWKRLHEQYPNAEVLLAGESAGGNLCLALCVAARDQGLPLPKRVYLQSPWLDLTLTSASQERQDGRDPFLGKRFLERDFARHYARDTPRDHPLLSPLFADLKGLPPFFVHVGSREVLLDDSRVFVQRAKQAGVDAHLEIWRGMWHAWPQIPFVPESLQALRQAATWLADG